MMAIAGGGAEQGGEEGARARREAGREMEAGVGS